MPLPVVALGIADQHHGEHVDLLGVELRQRRQRHLLLGTPCLPYVADGRIGRAVLGEDLNEAVELPIATLALGVVDGGDEVAIGSGLDAALDAQPGRHEVTQR